MDIPHPSEHRSWPSWFYPPDTDPDNPADHGRIFERAADVPEGWAADWTAHGENLNRAAPDAPVVKLSRADLRAELTKRDISWAVTSGTAALQAQLDEALALEALEESV